MLVASIHHFDLIRSIQGEPEGVYARSFPHPKFPEIEATRSSAILDYGMKTRCCLSIDNCWSFGRKHQTCTMRIEGFKLEASTMKHLQFGRLMLMVLVTAAGVSMADDADLDSFWKDEHASLTRQISKARGDEQGLKTSASASEAQYHNKHALIWESDRDALDVVLRRTRALLKSIANMSDAPDLSDKCQQLEAIEKTEARTGSAETGTVVRRQLYREACVLRRAIAFENPLLDFDEILVMTAGIGMGGEKLSGEQELWTEERSDYFQYIGFANTSKNGEGPIVLSAWKSGTPTVRKILEDGHGILKFHTCYDLHPDGTRLAFAGQTKTTTHEYRGSVAGHTCIFNVNVDGTDLTKLTRDDEFGDAFPCWLPNGRIAYVSECARWGGQRHVRMDRCGGVGASALVQRFLHNAEFAESSCNS